ncbi:hypothetical protein PMAYCL1PPCAC_20183, partial [Pristionchus mayeri]
LISTPFLLSMRSPLLIARRFKFAVVDTAEALAKRKVEVAKKYEIRPISMVDFPQLMDMDEEFVADEPLLQAVNATFPLYRRSLEVLFTQAIAAQNIVQTSLIVTHKATGRPIGFRLYSPVWRDEIRRCPYAIPKHAPNAYEMSAHAMQKLFYDKFWEMNPDETVTFRGETVHVSAGHRDSGLFPVLYEYGLRYYEIREKTGARIFTGPATKQKIEELNLLATMTAVYKGPETVKRVDGTEVALPCGPISLMT